MKVNQIHFTKTLCHVTSSVVNGNTWSTTNVRFEFYSSMSIGLCCRQCPFHSGRPDGRASEEPAYVLIDLLIHLPVYEARLQGRIFGFCSECRKLYGGSNKIYGGRWVKRYAASTKKSCSMYLKHTFRNDRYVLSLWKYRRTISRYLK